MFGIGFWEIALVLIISIIILGPEKFPTAFVQLLKIITKVRRKMSNFQEEIESQLRIDEFRDEALKYKNMVTDGLNDLKLDDDLEEEHKKYLNNSSKNILDSSVEEDGITEDEYIKKMVVKESKTSKNVKPKTGNKTEKSTTPKKIKPKTEKNTTSIKAKQKNENKTEKIDKKQ